MFDASPPSSDHPLMQDRAFAAALRLCGEDLITLPSGHMLLNRRIFGIPVLMLPRAAPPPDLIDQLETLGLQRRPLILSPEHPCKTPRAINVANPRGSTQSTSQPPATHAAPPSTKTGVTSSDRQSAAPCASSTAP